MTERTPKTFAEWQEKRRKEPRRYHRPEVQRQIVQDRIALGDAFYSKNNAVAPSELDKAIAVIKQHLGEAND